MELPEGAAATSQHRPLGAVIFVVLWGCRLLPSVLVPKARNREGLGVRLSWVLFTSKLF